MMKLSVAVLLFSVLALGAVAQDGCPNLSLGAASILLPATSKRNNFIFMGQNLRIYGNRLVAGGYGFQGWKGGAWSYVFRNGAWEFEQQILPPTRSTGAYFGLNLALYRNTLVVGHPFAQPYGPRSGQAEIYERNNGEWVHTQTIIAPSAQGDGEAGAYFGYAVALQGDTFVTGARNQIDPGTGLRKAGAVYVYKRFARGDWRLETIFRGPQGAGQYGDEVALDGVISGTPRVVVSSPRYRFGRFPIGRFYVYEKRGTAWTLLQATTPTEADSLVPNPNGDQHYGEGVSIVDNEIVVGGERGRTPLSGNGGSMYVYRLDPADGLFKQITGLFPDRPGVNFFGQRVGKFQNIYVTGAWGSTERGGKAGSGYIWGRCAGDNFTVLQKVFRTDEAGNRNGARDDEFGKVSRITEKWIAFGCPKCETFEGSTNRGAVYVYPYSVN